MKKPLIIILSLCLLLVACGEQATATKPKTSALFVLIENGGTVSANLQDGVKQTTMNLFEQITKLNRRKATRDVQIHILFSDKPYQISWSGTPQQLLEQAQEVIALMEFRASFSDLVMAYEQINTTIQITQPDDIKLYHIGLFIHVPFQNTDDEIQIAVPQDVPKNLALSSLLPKLSVLKFYGVHPDQDKKLSDYLSKHGVFARAKEGTLEFTLHGAAQTKSSLTKLL